MVIVEVIVLTYKERKMNQCNCKRDPDGKLKADDDYWTLIMVMVLTSEESKIDQCNDKKYPDGKLKADDDYCALMML